MSATELDAKKEFWTAVLYRLTDSKRFLDFVDANYHIAVAKDDEKKTVDVNVVEKPECVGPPLTVEQLLKLRNAVNNNEAMFMRVLKILGQKEPTVLLAHEKDLQEELKKKLDS
jgi:hypothetical protein